MTTSNKATFSIPLIDEARTFPDKNLMLNDKDEYTGQQKSLVPHLVYVGTGVDILHSTCSVESMLPLPREKKNVLRRELSKFQIFTSLKYMEVSRQDITKYFIEGQRSVNVCATLNKVRFLILLKVLKTSVFILFLSCTKFDPFNN